MISWHEGNLLDSNVNIIAHQVNLQGVMGGGIALQIAKRYKNVERVYIDVCKNHNEIKYLLSGEYLKITLDNGQEILNIFSQEENGDTNYKWLDKALMILKRKASLKGKTIGIPYNYGCGIANGKWEEVLKVFTKHFVESDTDLQIWELKEWQK